MAAPLGRPGRHPPPGSLHTLGRPVAPCRPSLQVPSSRGYRANQPRRARVRHLLAPALADRVPGHPHRRCWVALRFIRDRCRAGCDFEDSAISGRREEVARERARCSRFRLRRRRTGNQDDQDKKEPQPAPDHDENRTPMSFSHRNRHSPRTGASRRKRLYRLGAAHACLLSAVSRRPSRPKQDSNCEQSSDRGRDDCRYGMDRPTRRRGRTLRAGLRVQLVEEHQGKAETNQSNSQNSLQPPAQSVPTSSLRPFHAGRSSAVR